MVLLWRQTNDHIQTLYRIAPAIGPLAAADWLTDGGNTKRTAWQQDEKILNKDNVKNLKILWKLQLDNVPQEMHSLFPPLIVEKVKTTGTAPKQIAIEAGIADNIYAIDVETGQADLEEAFRISARRSGAAGRAIRFVLRAKPRRPVIGAGGCLRDATRCTRWPATAKLHSLNVADGEDVAPPFQVRLSQRQVVCAESVEQHPVHDHVARLRRQSQSDLGGEHRQIRTRR